MVFRIFVLVLNRDEILNPIVIQFVVALTTLLMVSRFVMDALRHRSRSNAMRITLITMDAVTQAMIVYSLGIMQHPSDKDYYYKVWAVLLVTLRYSVKLGRPAGIALKQTPLVDLMSSFWAANILHSKATKILKVNGWLLWSVNSLRIIHGFFSSEFANDSHRENMRLLTEYMRHEHKAGAQGDGESFDPCTMKGCRYLVLGETKKRKTRKNETDRQAREDTDMEGKTADIRNLVLALRDNDNEILTLEKIWKEPAGSSDALGGEHKDLCLSFALYKLLRRRFFNLGIHEAKLKRTRRLVLEGILGNSGNSERVFRISEAEVAFLNDFFNSRHAIVFAKGFPFIRLLLSTILIGGIVGMAFATHSFSKIATIKEVGGVHHGVIFTWFLLSFLLLKEIWEMATYVFSDWTKVLLLCKYVEKPWWLQGSVTRAVVRKLCSVSVFSRWHRKVGQCNLLFNNPFFVPWRYSRYFVHLSTEVKSAVVDCLRDCLAKRPLRLDNYLERAFDKADATNEFRASVSGAANGVEDCVHILLVWHIATCYCEIDLAERRKARSCRYSDGRAFSQRKPWKGDTDDLWSRYMIAKTLSQYCAYVLTLVPPLVPRNRLMASSVLRKVNKEKRELFRGKYESCPPCVLSTDILGRLQKYASGEIHLYDMEKDDTILKKGADLGKKLTDEAISGDKQLEDLWRFLSEFWAGFVIYLAASTTASQHKICLSSGGELMTHLWALLSHAGILGEVEHGDQAIDTMQTQGDIYDSATQF